MTMPDDTNPTAPENPPVENPTTPEPAPVEQPEPAGEPLPEGMESDPEGGVRFTEVPWPGY